MMIKSMCTMVAAIAPSLLAGLVVDSGAVVNNSATIMLEGNLTANGAVIGGGDVVLSGTDTTLVQGSVQKLTVQSAAKLSGAVAVGDTLTADSTLDLNGKQLDLGATGTLDETTGHIYGDSGTVTATRTLAAGTHTNIAGMGITLSPATDLGATTITRGHDAQAIGPKQSIDRWFAVVPTNSAVISGMNMQWRNDEATGDEAILRAYASTDGVQWRGEGGAVDSINNWLMLDSISPAFRWTAAFNRVPTLDSVAAPVIAAGGSGVISPERVSATDPDGDLLTLLIEGGENYTVVGDTIVPAAGFAGELTVPCRVTDGLDSSAVVAVAIAVRDEKKNNAPEIDSVNLAPIEKNSSGIVTPAMVHAYDADGDGVEVVLGEGDNYELAGWTITPEKDFTGTLTVPVLVTDGIDSSLWFDAEVSVFEKIIDFHKGLVTYDGETHVVVSPNPVPAGTPAVEIRSTGDFDRVEVKIFDHVGNVLDEGDAVVSNGEALFTWELRDRLVGGATVAFIIEYKEGVPVARKRVMIGVKQ